MAMAVNALAPSLTALQSAVRSAQSVLQMTSFGLARIVGASVGGAMAEAIGIGMVFRLGGFMLLAAAAVTFVPLCRRLED